jgi:hypothetical protein
LQHEDVAGLHPHGRQAAGHAMAAAADAQQVDAVGVVEGDAAWPTGRSGRLSPPITASTTRTSSVGSSMTTGRSASRSFSLALTISSFSACCSPFQQQHVAGQDLAVGVRRGEALAAAQDGDHETTASPAAFCRSRRRAERSNAQPSGTSTSVT